MIKISGLTSCSGLGENEGGISPFEFELENEPVFNADNSMLTG
jgi:hypothetical protein